MQLYAINGTWERSGVSSEWMEWSHGVSDEITGWFKVKGHRIRMYSSDNFGKPDQQFARGQLTQKKAFNAVELGPWGSNPGPEAVIDVWGAGIQKMASLTVNNYALYNHLFDQI